jgi:hypothetical protein
VFLTISGLNKEGKMPMRRFLLAVITLSALCVKAEESAKSAAETKESAEAAQSTETSCAPQFYVGVSMGHDRMIAKRTEELKAGTGTQLSFSNNKTQTANGFNGKLVAGFLWDIAGTSFAIGPEVYVGYGSAEVTLQGKTYDPDPRAQANKNYQSTFKQTFTMGTVLRAGFYLTKNNDFIYALGGIGCSKFENKFILSSQELIGGGRADTLTEKQGKFLKSPIVGIGFEKKINKVRVGIDIRYMPHSAWGNYSRTLPETEDKLSIRFKPKIITTNLTFSYLF